MHVCVGDIGGTNARMQVVDLDNKNKEVYTKLYPSNDFSGVDGILAQFVSDFSQEHSTAIASYCLAVCGPVVANTSELLAFNPPWKVDGAALSKQLGGAPVHLLNDFVAVGYAIRDVQYTDAGVVEVYSPTPGQPPASGARVCLGPGTGLGEVSISAQGDVHASEGGMSALVAHTQIDWDLIQYLRARDQVEHVEVERVVSGTGILNIYQFLLSYPPWLSELKETGHSVPATPCGTPATVVEAARQEDPTAMRAVSLFLTCLGQEAGTLALRFLPYGGVFIAGGGVASHMADILTDGRVARAYQEKGHCSGIVTPIPLYMLTDSDVGLAGCISYAKELLSTQ
eukprot:TRINITY_DN1037_c0_g1_i2.p1 TRINITY_DN1037_c0_g1~~TRINITY_DN1037_c0_g1_i2.p1  ORF type:complete len:342 (+),score=28.55 TRINITY_DN1037_c0_g1_i2:192-1217(+)